MKNVPYLIFLLPLLFSLHSCNIDVQGPVPDDTPIPINIDLGIWSKATDSHFESSDEVGVYIVNYDGQTPGTIVNSGNHADNIKLTYSGYQWDVEEELYWKDHTTPADFFCYYPYTPVVADVNALPVEVQADQSMIESYKASDFLYGKTPGVSPTPDPVQITANHVMSQLLINILPGKGYTTESLSNENITVEILSMMNNGTLDLSDGSVTVSGVAPVTITPYKIENLKYKVLLIPQTVTDAEVIRLTVADKTITLTNTKTFESNKRYTCDLTVNKESNGLDITIGGWEDAGEDFGGTVE